MKKKVNNFVKVQGNGHARCLAQSIYESWNNECYSNIKLIPCNSTQNFGETKALSANKLVLAAASKKFAAMLADTEEDVTIIVPGHNFATLELFLLYIYSGEILVSNFTPDLQSLMEEWEIHYPEVIPVATSESAGRSIILNNETPTLNCVRLSRLSSISTSTNKNIQQQKKHRNIITPRENLESEKKISDAHCASNRDSNHAKPCFKIADEPLQQKINPENTIATGLHPPIICGENSLMAVAEDVAVAGQQTKASVQPKDPVRKTNKTKSISAAPRSSNYVFLATYIKNSKNKVPSKAVTFTTTSKTVTESIAQVASGYSEEPLSIYPTSDENSSLTHFHRDANEGKMNKAKQNNLNPQEESVDQEDGESDELNTEEDLRDLNLAVNLLKYEKKRHQELNRSSQDLSGKVQRHRSYLKHFLGYESVVSETSDQLASRIACETCGKMVFRDYMPIHVKIHTTERPYLCDQCGQTFALPERLRNHLKNTHPDESQLQLHVCPDCGKTFKKANYLQRHLTLHNGEKPYACPYCDKTFRLPNVLLKHKRTHTGEKPYECETCHRRFSARTNYVVHLRTHRKKSRVLETTETESFVDPETQLLKCDVCGTCFHREYAFLIHKAAHKGEEPKLPCRHCTETFSSYKLLREHTRDQHADALYQCDQCPSMFVNKTALHSHLLIHTQGKQFSCDVCDKGFQTKVQLETHRRSIHSDIRPFPCRFCDKTFKSKLTQRQHERIHTGERPYQCPHCPKAFRQDVHLANHVRLHTGEKPFVCTYCNKAFAHKNNLMIHVKIHTGDRNQCSICGKVFRTIVKLRLHESTHTPPSIPLIKEVDEEMAEETL